MGSEDYAASKSGGEDGSSLAARRARLRGTLAKQALPPDPYTPDPYLAATPSSSASTPASSSSPAVEADVSTTTTVEDDTEQEQQSAPQNGAGEDHGSDPDLSALFATAPAPNAVNDIDPEEFESSEPEEEEVVESEPETEPARVDRRRGAPGPATMPPAGRLQSLTNSITTNPTIDPIAATAPSAGPIDPVEQFQLDPLPSAQPSAPVQSTPPPPQSAPPPSQMDILPPQGDIVNASTSSAMVPVAPNPVADAAPMPSLGSGSTNYVYGIQPEPFAPTQMQTQAIEIMNNIDQAMGACAMNLSELQKIAGEQTEALKGVAETLQNQSFFEIGLNLNSLMESLSAALEPMKAVGELVPAIDQLVSVMESRESGAQEESTRLSPEQLVTNLADQLSAGIIDPWTFKSAYMAVYPADHPADLLHRLVDLLGTQRLSGDLFRSAYEAVQSADPPPSSRLSSAEGEGGETRTVVKVVQDETLVAQLEELKRTNEEFQKKTDEIQKKLETKDQEFAGVLAAKEQELQEAQELLNSRWEEFNTRYDELAETLHKRDEALQEKESELARKESENNQLRAQMEELRDQTKDMVADLQRQLTRPPEQQQAPPQPAAKPAGFFDVAPGGNPQPPQQLFDAKPAQPLFGQNEQQQPSNQMDQGQQSQPQPPQPQQQQPPAQPPQPNQAVPRPAAPTTPFVSGAGSYGSGVRAQVFEVIVRQALAGAPWREICAGPMQVNNISPEEVEAEVKRRQALLKK